MATLLLNDTSDYHNGCKAVIKSFDFDESVKTFVNIETIDYTKFDRVILNGEGTMHDNSINAKKFLRMLKRAQGYGIPTELVNTVWQRMPDDYDDILSACENIEVREVNSQRELKEKHNISSKVVPDRSLKVDVEPHEYEYIKVYEGQYWQRRKLGRLGYPEINIFEQSWDEVVNRLRNAEVLVTGRHHEIYAAIKAECKFVIDVGNTWKNEGIFQSAGVEPIYVNQLDDVIAGKHDQDYEKIWNYIKSKGESCNGK